MCHHALFEQQDRAATIDAICEHLTDVTVAANCYASLAAAHRDLVLFLELYLDHISLRALQTL